ncbi:hypothetical protein HYALB_00002363 [Hymenoscyphus albidus]|uniref:Uncharacterized protein n=1 Tax=Hymenoscyphus albidus TaxID=595503 RepID=A0A9N9LIG8_9HELO|nr:hypothetical protein HYALB_00002363 [Hymenoscyphus albidus]
MFDVVCGTAKAIVAETQPRALAANGLQRQGLSERPVSCLNVVVSKIGISTVQCSTSIAFVRLAARQDLSSSYHISWKLWPASVGRKPDNSLATALFGLFCIKNGRCSALFTNYRILLLSEDGAAELGLIPDTLATSDGRIRGLVIGLGYLYYCLPNLEETAERRIDMNSASVLHLHILNINPPTPSLLNNGLGAKSFLPVSGTSSGEIIVSSSGASTPLATSAALGQLQLYRLDEVSWKEMCPAPTSMLSFQAFAQTDATLRWK